MMNWIKEKYRTGKPLLGCWLMSNSSMITELLSQFDFDWLLIDTEHGCDDYNVMLAHLQACTAGRAAPIVRIPANDPIYFKRALDLGASGVMVPNVNTPQEALNAVKSMRYPPQGLRGVSSSVRAGRYGRDFHDYFQRANSDLLTIVQIETGQALGHVDEIAAVEGVDVLFLGPSDLSVSLEIPFQTEDPLFQKAYHKILDACVKNGKQAGIIIKKIQDLEKTLNDGFHFVAIGSDLGFIRQQAQLVLTHISTCL